MKQDIQRIMLAAAKPLFLIFILYILKIMEVGMDWNFSRLGDRKSTRLNSSHRSQSRMPSSA